MRNRRTLETRRLKIFEVAEDVFACVTPNKGWGWVNGGFITRGKGLIYDTMFDLPTCKEMLQAFRQLSGLEYPEYVVISHPDGDHVYGNQLFDRSVLVMHEKTHEMILNADIKCFQQFQIDFDTFDQQPEAIQYYAKEFRGLDFRGIERHGGDLLLSQGANATILLDGMRCEIINVAPAHSEGDILLWLPTEKVVFTGDIVFGDGGVVSHSQEGMQLWAAALDKIISLNPKVVVSGHGSVADLAYVKKLRQYFDDMITRFDAAYSDELTALEIAKKIDVTEYINWLQPERLMTVVESLTAGRRGAQKPPLFETISKINLLREHYQTAYRDMIRPWDPMSAWTGTQAVLDALDD